jgi:hypothetical protein
MRARLFQIRILRLVNVLFALQADRLIMEVQSLMAALTRLPRDGALHPAVVSILEGVCDVFHVSPDCPPTMEQAIASAGLALCVVPSG